MLIRIQGRFFDLLPDNERQYREMTRMLRAKCLLPWVLLAWLFSTTVVLASPCCEVGELLPHAHGGTAVVGMHEVGLHEEMPVAPPCEHMVNADRNQSILSSTSLLTLSGHHHVVVAHVQPILNSRAALPAILASTPPPHTAHQSVYLRTSRLRI